MTDTPEQIAARLSPAQLRALMWLPASEDMARICPRLMEVSLRGMAQLSSGPAKGCVMPVGNYGSWWCLTTLGLAVRAVLAKETRDE